MNMQTVIVECVQVALDNGYELSPRKLTGKLYRPIVDITSSDDYIVISEANKPLGSGSTTLFRGSWRDLFFDHTFAQALWGKGDARILANGVRHVTRDYRPNWQERLAGLAVAESPFDYIYEHTIKVKGVEK